MSEMYADALCSSVSVSSCAYTVGLARFVGQFRQKQVVLCLRLSGWVRVVFFGGGCIHSLLDGEKCSAAEMHSKVGESCMGSTTIRFFGWAAALAQS